MAWLVAGVREDGMAGSGLPATVHRLPGLKASPALGDLLTQALHGVGFVSVAGGPAWLASNETRRPLAVVVAGPIEADGVNAGSHVLDATLQRLLDLSALLDGSTPSVMGGALEIQQLDDEAGEECWRTLALYGAPGDWPISNLVRRLPDGVERPHAPAAGWWSAMSEDPRLAVWVALARAAGSLPTQDLRVLQRCALFETMGSALIADADAQRTEDGSAPRTAGKARATKLREWLFAVLSRVLTHSAVPPAAVLPRGVPDLWSVCGIWADWRNAVAHEGRLSPATAGSFQVRAQRVADAALAIPDTTSVEEGLLDYGESLAACLELTLLDSMQWVPVADGLDPNA